MRSVLVVTKSDDHAGVAAVMERLRSRGRRPVRMDTDRYPMDVVVSTRFDGDRTIRSWRQGDVVVDGDDIDAVWYRRFAAGQGLPDLGDLRPASVDESRRTLYGAIANLDVRHLDRLEDVRRCDHKELQLQRARALGLSIPPTLFSNDAAAVRAFCDDIRAAGGAVVTKMQSSFAVWRDGEEHVVFTSVVDDEALQHLEELRFCPMVFQRRIDKRVELRATVVGDDVFCAAVDSQQSDKARVDWRKDGVGLLRKWTKYTLPASTSRALVQLVRSFGLGYAAADFIVTPEDTLVFLEINAGGEWFWLDEHCPGSPGLPIADAIAAFLAR